MKKILLLLISVSFMISCTENIIVKKQSIIGYDISDEGEKRDLVAGSIEIITIWENYIKGIKKNLILKFNRKSLNFNISKKILSKKLE